MTGIPQLMTWLCLKLTAETTVMKAAEEVNETDLGTIIRSIDQLTRGVYRKS